MRMFQVKESEKMCSKRIKMIIVMFLFVGGIYQDSLMACNLTMGYRTNSRPPLITKHPDNSGLYPHLYRTAAKKLGCQFNVVRKPKKRILRMLKSGQIDFYPGFNFTQERSKYTYYIENGLPGGDIGISRIDMPIITDLSQLQGRTLLVALGAPNLLEGVKGVEEIKVNGVAEMTIGKAMILLRKNRADFYIYNKASIEYHVKVNNVTDIKMHPDCCGGIKPLYLGFSRKSLNIKEISNPNFDNSKPQNEENPPTLLDKDSLSYKLQMVLKAMKENGETNKLYEDYYIDLSASDGVF